MPVDVAEKITTQLDIPTIGIGAGPSCNGQVLVLHDVLGLFERFTPRFVKTYVNLKEKALSAIASYKDEVEKGIFPTDSHSFK
jgi:3-methyl-2-oxobutanoate hydroxymethyltransferase